MERNIRGPVSVILLSIVTCGIYYLYWAWVTNKQINELLGAEAVGGGLMVLSFFCWPVSWYVWYKWDKSLLEITEGTRARYSSNFILWVILSVLGGLGTLVMSFQIQDTLNSIYES
ncbi:MAG: DUF4234 domain-containing protein [Oscillospiraceae bacterium]|nr:DUF4234 domain-containing protein [Oscillospiraceae bacterium]